MHLNWFCKKMHRARTARKLLKSLSSAGLNSSPREADHLICCQSSRNCSPVKMGAVRNSTQKHIYSMPEHRWDRLWTPESRVIYKKMTLGAMTESQEFSKFPPSGLDRKLEHPRVKFARVLPLCDIVRAFLSPSAHRAPASRQGTGSRTP